DRNKRFDATDDLPGNPFTIPIVIRRLIPWQQTVSVEEVRQATLTKATTPGIDGITTKLLQSVWGLIATPIQQLFQACVQTGYFPRTFRKAEVVMIQKPGKTDFSKTGTWRPVSLLSCLGKGLERLIAKRMAYLTILEGVASPQQVGALPGRAAVDLTTCLTHEIEKALDLGLTATLATMDVKGAFDSVLRNRLIIRLRQQGWPSSLIKLIYTFTSSRTARVRLEDTTTEDFPLTCGLPQGSPLSPILFLLYIADILADDRKLRFGYADDIGLLASSPSLEGNAAALSQEITQILNWGTDNKVAFDPAKCEAIHFSRKHNQSRDLPDIQAKDLTIKASTKPIRWLGVWFDRKLTFRHHVETKKAAAKKAVQFLQHLSNTKGGLPAAAARRAVIACVLPTALYGAETWYAGLNRPARNRSNTTTATSSAANQVATVSTGQKGLVKRAGKVITAAARAILPVWKTTPTSSLLRDAGLPTAKVALEGAWLKTVPDNHTVIYSNGSKAPEGATGFGFVIYRKNKRIAQGCGRLSTAEVFDGEAEGARAGLRRALLTSQGQPIHICIDNSSVIQGIRGMAPDSSQAAFLEIQEAVRIYNIQTHWYPGHQGIKGNEEADILAKEGTTLPAPRGQLATLSGIKRLAREQDGGSKRQRPVTPN
ncbi:reverse transcriptase, partial [Colletotrichum incanum]